MSCPLCTIPERESPAYKDSLIYIVETKDLKGHRVRAMACIRRHSAKPTFEELTAAYIKLHQYMNDKTEEVWYLIDNSYCSIPEHWHLMACDGVSGGDPLFDLTDKVQFQRSRVMVGIPAHNEANTVEQVVRTAKRYGKVLVLCNGSTDNTAEKALVAGAFIDVYSWSGYGLALQEIFNYAKFNTFDTLVTLDADGQHDPNEIPRFLEALREADVVVGNRFLTSSKTPVHRKAVITALNHVFNVGDSQCGFRAYNRKAIESINITEDGMGASLEILGKAKEAGLKIVEVPCTVTYDNPEPSFNKVLRQGMSLVETVFWGGVWARPYTTLGIPAAVLGAMSLLFGAYAFTIYMQQRYLIPSYALLCGVSFLGAVMLTSFTFFITIQRRLVKEIKNR